MEVEDFSWAQSYAKTAVATLPQFNRRIQRSVSQDPSVAYFSHADEACRAVELLDRRQVQIVVIKN
jgi:hypothetical protein